MQLTSPQDHVAGEVCIGKFTSIDNDLILSAASVVAEFRNQTHWDQSTRDKVKRFRFVVCTLVLAALALCVMSRSLFNLSIVEMTKEPVTPLVVDTTEQIEPINGGEETVTTDLAHESVSMNTIDVSDDAEARESGLRFDWSVSETNFLLSSFFIGYAPSMFLSGGLAEQYGSMILLSVCVVGSTLINVLTPLMAAYSYHTLAASRILLGVIQGGLVPACYDMFNKWLTVTEMSFFAPLIRVSMAIGMMVGTSLPGLLVSLGYNWTCNFYIGSSICLIWILLWFPLATSTPQTNRWIDESELRRIMRKKSTPLAVIKLSKFNDPTGSLSLSGQQVQQTNSLDLAAQAKPSIPWMSIMTNPSVLVLTLVKFTYNMGMDFLSIMSPFYLSEIHGASTATVSLIVCAGSALQMVLITFVGGLASYLIRNRCLGFSRTHWRKIFQGSANFGMTLIFYLVPFASQLNQVAGLFMLVYFWSMFGAGGESMVPYDLSFKYPATIMGFAHSISIMSGFVVPSISSLILGDQKQDPARWNTLFHSIAVFMVLGGLAFVWILKSKPFLANERAKYDQLLAKQESKLQHTAGQSKDSQPS